MLKFSLESDYSPKGDQPKAIKDLLSGHTKKLKKQTLKGVTGSGKTFTIAHVIQKIDKPVLVVAPNKTLTAQLYAEFKDLFPENGVGIYISYYDYYQPESYVATKDLYISKEVSINEEIEKLRHKTLKLLSERDDVIIIATVSCIFGTGPPKNYRDARIILREGKNSVGREELMLELVRLQYMRNDIDFKPKTFRVRGDIVEINPIWTDEIIRVEFFGDEIDRLSWVDGITGTIIEDNEEIVIYPATQFMTEEQRVESVLQEIEEELSSYHNQLLKENKLVEAQRIQQRIKYDLEMLKEYKYCKGIENYSRYFAGKDPGEVPFTLLDHFPENFLTIIDESHVTVPQIKGMYKGDRSRKESLVTHGFRLPSALDNRPLTWEEFIHLIDETIFMSATPGPYELENSDQIVEQIIRPTGLIDPEIEIYPTTGQIDHLYSEIIKATANNERVIVTTLTKRMAEDLTDYLGSLDIRVRYLHSDIDTLERVLILRDLRRGDFDVIVGINLLREGLDLPEVALVAVLDADKEGFLRSQKSLTQVIGRASRNVRGRVIMYADRETDSIKGTVQENNRRRLIQQRYNREHNIVPKTIQKEVKSMIEVLVDAEIDFGKIDKEKAGMMSNEELTDVILELQTQMSEAASRLEFELAAKFRDMIKELEEQFR